MTDIVNDNWIFPVSHNLQLKLEIHSRKIYIEFRNFIMIPSALQNTLSSVQRYIELDDDGLSSAKYRSVSSVRRKWKQNIMFPTVLGSVDINLRDTKRKDGSEWNLNSNLLLNFERAFSLSESFRSHNIILSMLETKTPKKRKVSRGGNGGISQF